MTFDNAAAQAWVTAGCSVVPLRTDGSKRPVGDWKPAQTTAADTATVERWSAAYDGFGVVAGTVSGELEMFELEGRAVTEGLLQRLQNDLNDNGFGEIWAKLSAGYIQGSPSGGLHFVYRVDGKARGNTKLARRPATAEELDENPDELVKVLMETRGEGGQFVAAPSAGRTHASGKSWTALNGSPATMVTLTVDERDNLYGIASFSDQIPAPTPPPISTGRLRSAGDTGKRPGEDYDERATWDDILTPEGWTKSRLGKGFGWKRPGKTDPGISATTGQAADGVDRLYVFSTSTTFEAEKPYTKFAAYTHLHHGGDFNAAARDLGRQGYGDPYKPERANPFEGIIPPITEGNLALVHQLDDHRATAAERMLSDDANALSLVETFGDRLRYCPERGRWLAWSGTHWEWQAPTGGAAREFAKLLARDFPEDSKEAGSWKKRSLSSVGTSAMLTQAQTDPRITVSIDDLDSYPWELNTPAGIVDLRNGHISPCEPSRLHTRITGCAADPDADPAGWQTFLGDTFKDPTLIDYLRRLVGYSAVGMVGPHVLPFCHGSGGNGKGVFLEAVVKVLGDYATTAPSGFLMATMHASHETEIARLAGARMVLCSEVNEDDRFDEAKVKQLTGGDTLTARFMRQDHFTFNATHQLWLMGNHQPAVRSGGRSFWRRLRLIPFEHEVPEDKIVDDLQGILVRQHGPAILAWIVAGAAEYHRGGLGEPESVKAATAGYAKDQDTVARFVEECCHIGGGDYVQIKVSIVRKAYEQWCLSEGEEPVTAKAFGLALKNRFGVETKRTNVARMYVGMTLLVNEDGTIGDDTNDANASDGGRY